MALKKDHISRLHDQLFPFHIVIDSHLMIKAVGKSAKKLFPGAINQPFERMFAISRPKIELTFQSISQNLDTLYVFKSVTGDELQIKGQLVLMPEGDLLLVFTPIVRDVVFLKEYNITMGDFPYYDTTLELLFALQASQRALHEARRLSNEFEQKVIERTSQLKEVNDSLQEQNEEYLIQQTQLNNQSLFLEEKNKKLQHAREMIHAKNKQLKQHSTRLEQEVSERTKELTKANENLIQRNSQLEQFGFTVAHNLRAPIARVLGLLNIMKLEALITPQNIFYTDNIHSEIKRLDEVVQDLSHMLEITTDSDRPFDVIHLPNVIQKTLQGLTSQIEQSGATFQMQIEVEMLYTVPSYLENVLTELVSNSIKFRSPERPLKILLVAKKQGELIIPVKVSHRTGAN